MYDGQVPGVDAILPWEAWSGGDKLEEPASLVEAVNQPVHQDQGGCMLSGLEKMFGLAWGLC